MSKEIPEELKSLLIDSRKVCVLTGAGVSAESGIPTFRGGGNSVVWNGMPFEQISSVQMVRKDLDAVWEWFDYRRGLYKECQPNAAHFALAEWQKRYDEFTLVTQNVDGLHERAGSKNVIELHGNINRAKCIDCRKTHQLNAEIIPHQPTNCDKCGAKLRPDVVLFGEMLPVGAFETAEKSANSCEILFIIGTSAFVYPAIGLAELAKYAGAKLVEINPEETLMTDFCDFHLRGKAGEIVPLL
jgi:NAD-dependent deacetylase